YARQPLEARILNEFRLASDAIAQFVFRKAAEEERTRLLKETTEARNEVEVLNQIGRTLAAELDLQKLTQAATDAATQLDKAEFGVFHFNTTDAAGDDQSLHAASGVPPEGFDKLPRTAVLAPFL